MMKCNFVLPNLALKNSQQLGKVSTETAKPQPDDFTPSPDDVMCGRGKKCYEHNENFRALIASHLSECSSAPSKPEKSRIVSTVFDEITSNGQFVRFDTKKKQWLSVPEGTSREKISQGFRDCLTDQYRSSKDCRQRKRRQQREAEKVPLDITSEPAAKKARRTSPPTPLKTSDALQQLLAFSQQMASKADLGPETPQEIMEEAPNAVESVDLLSDPFHPIPCDTFKPSHRSSHRMFGSCSSIVITEAELVVFNALSA